MTESQIFEVELRDGNRMKVTAINKVMAKRIAMKTAEMITGEETEVVRVRRATDWEADQDG